jgi:nitroimidazol reductase NimA-like FMN-containing flavoprotein (pyridoxamine 5'-phosphate oxidase superfamily)
VSSGEGPGADRPYMPGYGISSSPEGQLPWSWAAERLVAARNYFVATVRDAPARPHVMPVWGVWIDDAFYFSTSRTSRKARNLRANSHCVVTPESGSEAVIVEGVASVVDDAEFTRRVIKIYEAKYAWDMTGYDDPLWCVRPTTVFAFIEAAGDFPSTATRWTFK